MKLLSSYSVRTWIKLSASLELSLLLSTDVDHPDLELVVERLQSLGRIGSWLTTQAGKLKNVFGRGASGASKVKLKPTGTGGVKKVRSTNPRGPAKNLRRKNVTGDVIPNLGDKVKKGLKLAALGGAATLVGMGIDNALNSDKDDESKIKPDTKLLLVVMVLIIMVMIKNQLKHMGGGRDHTRFTIVQQII